MKTAAKIFSVVAVAVIIAGGLVFLQKHLAYASLADIIPQIKSVTVYDIDRATAADSNALASATSAPFPVDVFCRASASATHESGGTVWKGSSLAVLNLSDGTQRRARFSYYGGFFTVEGSNGRFVVPGGGASEFQRLHEQLIQEQFVPKRHERNKNRNGQAPKDGKDKGAFELYALWSEVVALSVLSVRG